MPAVAPPSYQTCAAGTAPGELDCAQLSLSVRSRYIPEWTLSEAPNCRDGVPEPNGTRTIAAAPSLRVGAHARTGECGLRVLGAVSLHLQHANFDALGRVSPASPSSRISAERCADEQRRDGRSPPFGRPVPNAGGGPPRYSWALISNSNGLLTSLTSLTAWAPPTGDTDLSSRPGFCRASRSLRFKLISYCHVLTLNDRVHAHIGAIRETKQEVS